MILQASFHDNTRHLDAVFAEKKKDFSASFAQEINIVGDASKIPTFAGPYEVTPKVDAQQLETAQKMMSDDVVVLGIPYAEVTNTAGGITATIG